MMLKTEALRQEHVEDSAALFAARYRAGREVVASLPRRYEEGNSVLPQLRNLGGRTPGVVAIQEGRLCGFLLGQVIPSWRGKRAIYCPEWAHAAEPESQHEIYRSMYAHLCHRWIANGCFTHLVTVLAHERGAIDACFWSGFGLAAVDAMRALDPLQGRVPRIEIRRAGGNDIDIVIRLTHELQRYLAAAPTCLALVEKRGRECFEQQLADPAHPTWLAYRNSEVTAVLGLQPANPSACHIIRDERTVSVCRPFTRAHVRGTGVGTALLDHALAWARSRGHQRCAVDFEPENVPGTRFWLRHFQPICYTLARHVDERIAWANNKRNDKRFW